MLDEVHYDNMSGKQLMLAMHTRHDQILDKMREYHTSLLRPWRRIYLYDKLNDIYRLALAYLRDNQVDKAKQSVMSIRSDAYDKYERKQHEIDYFGYGRDTNRERIMYKQIYEEADQVLTALASY